MNYINNLNKLPEKELFEQAHKCLETYDKKLSKKAHDYAISSRKIYYPELSDKLRYLVWLQLEKKNNYYILELDSDLEITDDFITVL